jgi:hypothetical protein
MENESAVIIRLTQNAIQTMGNIKRIIGLMPAKNIIGLIDRLDLEANPRESKLGPITDAIQDSILEDQSSQGDKLFPFKSKGILLASSQYEELERNRYELEFVDDMTEGILDGGHNTLAIGTFILREAARALEKPEPKKRDIEIWEKFKDVWGEDRCDIDQYLELIRNDKDALVERGVSILDFVVPVELLVPSDMDDALCVEGFRRSLLEICDARNNNAQLSEDTKGNQEGLFDSFRALFEEKDGDFASTISWKTNDGGTIKSRDLAALAWITLSVTSWVQPGPDNIVDAPSPVSVYSGKAKCLEKYLDLMRDEHISKSSSASQKELKDRQVESALKVATDIPWLFDRIYQLFPSYYNDNGSFGNINAVRHLKNSKGEYWTPFLRRTADNPVPDGFIYPLVYGLKALVRRNPETGLVEWVTDPYEFLESPAFKDVVHVYSGVIQQSDYDPQKVGKGLFSYTSAEQSVKLAYITSKNLI